MSFCRNMSIKGFTLAELLIALAILGVIATFTIPKILTAQTNGKYNAIAKESMGMVSGAFEQAQQAGTLSATTKPSDLTPYMNYVVYDTSTVVDDITGNSSTTCTSTAPCIRLHNGGILMFDNGNAFGGTATTNMIDFRLDPDGVYSGTTNGQGKMLIFALYYNGGIMTWDNLKPGTVGSYGSYSSNSAAVPSWFNW